MNWTGGIIDSGQASVIENAGTFDASGDNVMRDGSVVVGALHVHNTGIFRKSAGTGTTTIAVPFDNDGTVSAGAGTLSFTGGDDGATAIGSFGGTGPGIVSFDTGIYGLGNGASFTGRVTITGATVNVTGNVSATSAATLTQSNGTIGGTGTLTVSGSFAWSGGTQTDAGNTTIASTATLTISADAAAARRPHAPEQRHRELDRRHYRLGPGLGDRERRHLRRQRRQRHASTAPCVVGALHVHNTGIFTKSAGTGTTSISAEFDNDGTVSASAGTLSLGGGGGGVSESGSFTANLGATLEFAGGSFSARGGLLCLRRRDREGVRRHGRLRRHLQRDGHHPR